MNTVGLGYWARQLSVGTEDVPSAPDSVQAYPASSQSEDILWCPLPGSLSPSSHPSPFISLSLCFLPSFCCVSFLFCCPHPVVPLSLASLIFSTFSAFCPFSGHPWLSHLLCPETTSPHFLSSDPSGPEIPSFSAHRPLLPPKVLTPQHTALCVTVHTLGLWRGLIAKACLYPWWCLIGSIGGWGLKVWGWVAREWTPLYPFLHWWTFRLLPCLGYCKQCWDEHWGACIFPDNVFLQIHAHECDWRVIW